MRIGVISDIHGNLEAFMEVLKDLELSGVERVVCLGDNIGYGPEPERVVGLIRARNIPCVMGNHELGLVDPAYLSWFNPVARKSLMITRDLLSPESFAFMRSLQTSMTYEGCLCVHGCPPASITTYLFEARGFQLRQIFTNMKEKISFVGHTHDLEIISFDGHDIISARLREGSVALKKDLKYIVNAGSVGQPRDGNNNAKYVILDTQRQTLDVRYVPYDIGVTASAILELGFPSVNARRLW